MSSGYKSGRRGRHLASLIGVSVALASLAGCKTGAVRTTPSATAAAIPTALLVPAGAVSGGSSDGDCCAPPTRRPYALVTARPTATGNLPAATSNVSAPAGNVSVDPRFQEQVVDTDQDGLIDQLVLTTTIKVPAAGEYMVNTALLDQERSQIESTGTGEISLVAGTQPLSLVYDGANIYEAGCWGPYTPIVTIVYFGKATTILLEDERLDRTQAYDFRQFQHDRVSVDVRSLSSKGVDTNADGLYDELDITGVVTVEDPGLYIVNSGLYGNAPPGQIADEYVTFQLAAGPNQFTVVYLGSDIAASHEDGPYSLFDMEIYLQSDPMGDLDSVHPHYVTPAYKASQFGG